jgi:CRISPR-associated protein Cas5d
MSIKPKNAIEFKVRGRHALFTDPLTKVGGEKCSYHVPTYESLKGIAKSIYWKPTFVWVVDQMRVMKRIRTQTKGTKPLEFGGGNTLAIYTFLADVEYQIQAHFEWNMAQPDLAPDRVEGKHFAIATRMLERGGRQDVFLGTRDCQGYVEPCEFGAGSGELDGTGELGFGLMFHGFDYPDETGEGKLNARFWNPRLVDGILRFPRPEDCSMRKFIRDMTAKRFGVGKNLKPVDAEATELGA